MPRPSSTQPTEVELEILGAIWEAGKATAREIHDRISRTRDTNYSTTVKMLAVMSDKGMVKRDESVRPMLFIAATSQQKTQTKMLKNLIQKAYDGSTGSLVLQALSSNKASKEEIDKIRQLLDTLEGDTK